MKREPEKVVRRVFGAGRWFPGDADELRATVEGSLKAASLPGLPQGPLHAVIAPHAGYVYSGGVAGYSYRALQEAVNCGQKVETVVVLGFSHRESFAGVALMDGDAIETPLGATPLDVEAAELLEASSGRLRRNYRPHMGEHSAENQVPFVQVAAPDARLVIAMIGDHEGATIDALAAGLQALAGKKRIVVAASTDLLHDPDYDHVCEVDRGTLGKIVALDAKGLAASWNYGNQVCCGISCVLTAMRYAREQGAGGGILLRYRNSGDDFPESRGNWVVGYGAVAFFGASR